MSVNPASEPLPRYLDVRQVARYLSLNEKKVYALVADGRIPGTKVTGKWMFPRELVDRWMLESSHGGLLADRLAVAGADDPLLQRVVLGLARGLDGRGLVSHTPTGTRPGLSLLASQRADVALIHWGPDRESHLRHPALLGHYDGHRRWVVVRALRREQGFMLSQGLLEDGMAADDLLARPLRWAARPEGSGAQRLFDETLRRTGVDTGALLVAMEAPSERDAAAAVVLGQVDAAPGSRAAASEHGLGFIPTAWTCLDLVLERRIYFRALFQALVARLAADETARLATTLGGYDLGEAGRLVWGAE